MVVLDQIPKWHASVIVFPISKNWVCNWSCHSIIGTIRVAMFWLPYPPFSPRYRRIWYRKGLFNSAEEKVDLGYLLTSSAQVSTPMLVVILTQRRRHQSHCYCQSRRSTINKRLGPHESEIFHVKPVSSAGTRLRVLAQHGTNWSYR